MQKKAREEVQAVFGDSHAEAYASFEETKEFTYLEMVIKESLRLYPPVTFFLPRQVMKPTMLGDCLIDSNILVMISVHQVHRNPKHWNEPEKFDPMRFSKDIAPFSWIPFGIGARTCMGKQFSLLEQKVFLSMILRNYEVKLPADSPHRDEPKFTATGVQSINGLELIFNKI